MQATVELLDLKPSAIEHIDKPLFDQTKGQLHFQAARDLMELDTKPCEAILIVEFYEDVAERLTRLASMRLGLRTLICESAAEMNHVWAMRKAGLSLLTGRVGPAKPRTGVTLCSCHPEAGGSAQKDLAQAIGSRVRVAPAARLRRKILRRLRGSG